MRQVFWSTTVLISLAVICNVAESRTIVKREEHHPDPHVDPHLKDLTDYSINRDKRKVEVVTGVKNAVLGFVFNGKHSKGFAWEVATTTPKGPTTTEDIVIFEPGKPVSLDIPGELFGSSFTLVTNLSNTVGDFMINSALRTQRLLESMRPFLRKVFGSKAIVIEATTDKPIFSDPNSV
ncbi:hypothetical protein NQ315_015530 [Exocentrus adspersus]|uniref:Uncharacterized protein n=1 Tax=Exocentrus adspersus TaxID=1586481 RepID=A0AAV8VP55_9CUCU|nr:hypothetical protein NQ315_015530 [Exocentrus adspersus]